MNSDGDVTPPRLTSSTPGSPNRLGSAGLATTNSGVTTPKPSAARQAANANQLTTTTAAVFTTNEVAVIAPPSQIASGQRASSSSTPLLISSVTPPPLHSPPPPPADRCTFAAAAAAASSSSASLGFRARTTPHSNSSGGSNGVVGGAAPSTTNTGALRFTCCRCRRSFFVSPDERRTSVTKHSSSLAQEAPAKLVDRLSRSFAAHDAMNTEDASDPFSGPAAPSSAPLAPSLQAAVRSSYTTSGTGQRYRPLVPPRVSEHTVSTRHQDTKATSDALAEQRALIDALSLDLFTPAEVYSRAQLTELLTHAQEVLDLEDARAAPRCTRFAVANPHSLCDLAPPLSFSSAPSPTSAHTTRNARWGQHCKVAGAQLNASDTAAVVCLDEGASVVLEMSQLVSHGVQVRMPSFRMAEKGAEGTGDEGGEEEGNAMAATGQSRNGKTDNSGSSSSDLTAVETLVMSREGEGDPPNDPRSTAHREATPLRHPLQEHRSEDDDGDAGAAADGHTGPSRVGNDAAETAVRTFATPPLPPPSSSSPSVPEACSEQVHYMDTPCPAFAEKAPRQPTGNLTSAATALPFGALYRCWMRLLVHSSSASSSTLPAQPLCLDCWWEACIPPLQQRTTNALEGIESLHSILRCHSHEEKTRLWTLVSDATTAHTDPTPALRQEGDDDDGRRAIIRAASSPCTTQQQQPCPPSLSLNSVAANLFGEDEKEWLSTMAALSAPHHPRKPEGLLRTADARRSATPPPIRRSLSDRDENRNGSTAQRDTSVLQERQAELQELLLEMEEVRAQQTSLDLQNDELRGVLQALDTAHINTAPPPPSTAVFDGSGGDPAGQSAYRPALASTKDRNTPANWAGLAVAHNIREVHDAFTCRDEAAERQHMMRDLAARHAFLSATSIDAVCFPVDVSGPMGTIAGLRLGLVAPYSGSSRPPNQTARHTDVGQRDGIPSDAARSCAVEEAMCLKGFVRRQVQYTQLLLSGHTAGANVDYVEASHEDHTSAGAAAPALLSSTTTTTVVSPRVSAAEVNAACGYLLLLLNYLANVNGLSFQTAILRPAGDRSTVALLKCTSKGPGVRAGAAATSHAAASSFAIPFSFFGLFTNTAPSAASSNDRPDSPSSVSAWTAAAASASRSSCVVDYEVDFYLTDRLFAWRTFGGACVAVAACVRELSDALHESLRCWQLREAVVRRHSPAEVAESTDTEATAAAANEHGGRERSSSLTKGAAPASLLRLVETLEQSAGVGGAPAETDDPAAASPPPDCEAAVTAADAAVAAPFPLRPPYRVQGDTVDGFSVRHGSVTEAIWTLGMKKLLANVQWCMGATVELERLYAITGDDEVSGEE
ncbi:hypothetical protein ABB37_09042 [Leptomonas pyrrhocoris]|uniref:Uncharacterized protein n=1 Tax=Leptomonas pyrrhocoris TaxID=157538 RepID=A0A0N0DRI4_LEPPY|nr:hypothetical protein ABB37_09042 [Leptomonas pyrrhocoris]KPA74742.1 hypothetical protein ABB37_09042 [Leptomonas pyrrhocoris]|eukprot:XP_015653181.1 hypothetical protein ABB37_09042 [Leptomonas pyrrhocoris]